MAFRLMRCPSCSHKLRPGSALCGKCGETTPAFNRWIGVSQHLAITLAVILVVLFLGNRVTASQ